MARSAFEVTVSGPLFEGDNVRQVLDTFAEDTRREVGDHALSEVLAITDKALRHPTGYYRSKIEHDGEGHVGYGGQQTVIYGPWLEGNSSRNKTSRFKGYRIFRKGRTRVRKTAPDMAAEIMARHIGKLQAQ